MSRRRWGVGAIALVSAVTLTLA
ncbi:MAG: hypothetical protein K0S70_1956, partial [Microbacterium sp.]|nr:hypothetical protein [Microbacterium sp.]